jgi:hypothetical protein
VEGTSHGTDYDIVAGKATAGLVRRPCVGRVRGGRFSRAARVLQGLVRGP